MFKRAHSKQSECLKTIFACNIYIVFLAQRFHLFHSGKRWLSQWTSMRVKYFLCLSTLVQIQSRFESALFPFLALCLSFAFLRIYHIRVLLGLQSSFLITRIVSGPGFRLYYLYGVRADIHIYIYLYITRVFRIVAGLFIQFAFLTNYFSLVNDLSWLLFVYFIILLESFSPVFPENYSGGIQIWHNLYFYFGKHFLAKY